MARLSDVPLEVYAEEEKDGSCFFLLLFCFHSFGLEQNMMNDSCELMVMFSCATCDHQPNAVLVMYMMYMMSIYDSYL